MAPMDGRAPSENPAQQADGEERSGRLRGGQVTAQVIPLTRQADVEGGAGVDGRPDRIVEHGAAGGDIPHRNGMPIRGESTISVGGGVPTHGSHECGDHTDHGSHRRTASSTNGV